MRNSLSLKNSPQEFGRTAAAQHLHKVGKAAAASNNTIDKASVRDEHGYDDGLVHNHRWAMSTDRHG